MSGVEEVMKEEEEEVILNLKTQIAFLQRRVKELEADNAKLSSQISNCCCHKTKLTPDGCAVLPRRSSLGEPGSVTRALDHHPTRYIALKVMYFGKRFYGFASQTQMDPTVESEIFKALERTRLLVGDRNGIQYSRCGRTDKGVSAVGQVIALFVRSKLKNTDTNNNISGESVLEEQKEGEIDYVRVLNGVLPKDIRITGWCPVPLGFSARFSCLSREYKYFFWSDDLNLLDMETAGKKFIGEHNFTNFCKMDAVKVHIYRRQVTSFEISTCDTRFGGHQLCAITLKGSAFLWHQVRCMVAVLFMIGQGLESPDLVDVLLDVDMTPRKPQYPMAPEIPLVLRSSEFEGLKFTCSSDAGQALRVHLGNECRMYYLQASIFREALLTCVPLSDDKSFSNGRTAKKKVSHIPLMSRPTEPSYEERRAKLGLPKMKIGGIVDAD